MSNLLEKLRRWIDGDIYETNILEQKFSSDTVDKRARSQTLVNKIIAEILSFLQDEIILFSNGKIYIPNSFIIFLSPEIDKDIGKDKRRILENVLSDLILEEVQKISDKGQINVEKLNFSLKVDGTLQGNEVLVKAVSDETNKTVRAETLNEEQQDNVLNADGKFQTKLYKGINDLTLKLNEINNFHICPSCNTANSFGNYFCLECGEKLVEDATVADDSNKSENGSKSILYHIEILKNDIIIERIPVTQSKILIGRESSKCAANIRLYSQNFHISSSHLYLIMNEKGNLYAKILTDNQTIIDGKQPLKNEEVYLQKNSEIKIYEFALRFVF